MRLLGYTASHVGMHQGVGVGLLVQARRAATVLNMTVRAFEEDKSGRVYQVSDNEALDAVWAIQKDPARSKNG